MQVDPEVVALVEVLDILEVVGTVVENQLVRNQLAIHQQNNQGVVLVDCLYSFSIND